MTLTGDTVVLDHKKVHPLFSVPKLAATAVQNGVVPTPATPDPSCSPASEHAHDTIDMSSRDSIADMSREHKRRKIDPENCQATTTTPFGSQRNETFDQPPFLGLDDPEHNAATSAGPSLTVPAPKKLLLFNPKTGTIGSPPKAKVPTEPELSAPKKRNRPKKSHLVTIGYGKKDLTTRHRIAKKIDSIVKGNTRIFELVELPILVTTPQAKQPKKALTKNPKAAPTAKPASALSAHPFFLGKVQAPASPQQKRHTIFTSTPCSPRHVKQPPPSFHAPPFGTKSGLLKFPGAQHPAFPWRGTSHVRCEDEATRLHHNKRAHERMSGVTRRKAKGQHVGISADESLMTEILSQLDIANVASGLRCQDDQTFEPPPPLLRVPSRHFESGKKLQARVLGELHATGNKSQHPALRAAFQRIAKESSAFDRSTCETMAWTTKYAPVTSETVLQSGSEAMIIRDWLYALKVQSVDTGVVDAANVKPKETQAAPKKKRRRAKLENFIVSDEEDLGFAGAESDDELDWEADNGKGERKKTVHRPITVDKRVSNTILLSGPHGCGKTAAIYAAAKELDFEVFEINAGARRAGKDIMERVGDMTRNHLVQHRQAEEEKTAPEVDDEVARDLKSGKQGTMMNFFQTKASKPSKPSPAPKPKKEASTIEIQPEVHSAIRKSTKSQKQSLILLEEVDVLFEEDKQFWNTVIDMIIQSRRPFVLTCTEETPVKVFWKHLYGIFRFSAPPTDLAVDLLLLVAANEGHSLKRTAVESLYESRHRDLRAAMTELNYWCQIGVGDPQGGFNWFYPRWPKGVDKDEKGDTVRVVSDGTYQEGMGWLARDIADAANLAQTSDDQVQYDVWNEWGIDIGQANDKFSSWASASSATITTSQSRLDLLAASDEFTAAMSDADLCSYGAFATDYDVRLDTTLPPLPSKAKEDIVLGCPLLEVHLSSVATGVPAYTSIAIEHLARSLLPYSTTAGTESKSSPEENAMRSIRSSFREPKAEPVKRFDYSRAFDVLAFEHGVIGNALEPSVFDRTMEVLALDVTPYVRSIVAYDERLRQERLLRSNILSEGGKPKKKMRTTRSALSALEGGVRASTRREKYFKADVNAHLVMKTGISGRDTTVHHGEFSNASQDMGSSAATSPSMEEEDEDAASSTGRKRHRRQIRDESPDELA